MKLARQISDRAGEILESHPHFRGRSQWVKCRCANGCLYLNGALPSFYLKQLAQEMLRDIDGVDLIVNQIVVASPTGQVGHRGERQKKHKPR